MTDAEKLTKIREALKKHFSKMSEILVPFNEGLIALEEVDREEGELSKETISTITRIVIT
ncbi:MAG: hypothetical protein WC806_02115 [Candidatus Gracilibacteria bacterium]|jgi:hypothetical protein